MQGTKLEKKNNYRISLRQVWTFLAAAVLYFALFCLFPIVLVLGAGLVSGFAAKSLEGTAQAVALSLAQLSGAEVLPSFAICAGFAAVCAALLAARRSVRSIATFRQITVLLVYASIAGFALSACQSKVNGVPLRTFAGLVRELICSGVL